MTTRRNVLMLAGSALVLAGCRETAKPAAIAPDVLLAESDRGLLRLAPAGEQVLGAAAATFDGSYLYAARPGTLDRVDPASGTALGNTALADGWIPRVVSSDGRVCALSRTGASGRPAARTRTRLLITAPGGQTERDLAGVIEPDAFTSDGTGLFVLEWLPAAAPDHYRVRLLDLATGEVQPLNTRDKTPVPPGAEEEMRGDGRQAVLSADRTMLFTLYTHQPGHRHTRDLLSGRPGGAHAFVHVLHLIERWAYCLDLPHPFGEGPAAGHALAADGRTLFVADLNSGKLAYASPSSLAIERVVDVPPVAGSQAALALTTDGRILVGAGGVTVLDRASGRRTGRWELPEPVRGLALSRDGRRLYAGGTGRVTWLDAGTGTRSGEVAAAGLTALRHVV
ncbi:YncE family protein [Actinoplanes subglobosus]|uniref:YncE family protein n=1 Tax=Actinoplanes subglobosus TaxID=1547892 RepID=A0ABV8IYF4_9ACTN